MKEIAAGKLEAIDRLVKLIDRECRLWGLYQLAPAETPSEKTPHILIVETALATLPTDQVGEI